LKVLFETTPAALAELLPPPLEPTPEPLGMAFIRELANTTTVGPYECAGLFLRARYQDITGHYCISLPTSTAEAVIFGRETYGEPRKQAKIIFERQDEYVWGSAERNEVRFLSLRGRIASAAATGRQLESYFTFKFSPRADGAGFESPPRLVELVEDVNVQHAESGRGELVFRDSAHDPLADIPVSQVGDATYSEGHFYTTARVLTDVDPDAFLPYAFNGLDAIELVAEGTLLHAQAARRGRDGRGRWRQTTTAI
jgi:acetoacetate decarboxylase